MGKTFKKVLGITIGAVAAWTFAVKPRIWHKPDLTEIRRYDYAHRGFFNPEKKIPENSLPAVRSAIEHGYGIVLDVRLTRDGIPVVFHDSRLARMTGQEGTIENTMLADLKGMKLGDTEETIPTLEEALKLIDGQVPVLLDLHAEKGSIDALCDQTCDVLDSYEGVFAIQSIDPRVLKWYKDHRDEYIRGQKVSFAHRSGSGIKSLIWDFFCSSLLMNFIVGPDFITTNIDHRQNPSLWLCRLVYRVPRMDWIVRTLEDYELVKTDGSTAVFEDIEP
ncbi:MAG: glycerophosphodiester phosphodiesterase family protein [Eubacterium sp.]|nr:glycerophosphodiester phosphodiesterase family protein [Eubacterium sp.]